MIGYRYFSEDGIFWRYHFAALLPLSMPHVKIQLGEIKASWLLIRRKALFVRWEEDFDELGVSEWWHIIKDGQERIEDLSKKTRNLIRRASKEGFFAEPATLDEILNEGFSVYEAASDRYDTFEPLFSESQFQAAVSKLPPETEFWAVRHVDNKRMVAFSENFVRDGACFYVTMWLVPDAMRRFAGYLLFHEMNKHYLNFRGCEYVSDGARSISHQTKIHEFLEQKFRFRKAYATLRIAYAPGFGLLIKALYLFRGQLARGVAKGVGRKLGVLLEQERIRRSCADRSGRIG